MEFKHCLFSGLLFIACTSSLFAQDQNLEQKRFIEVWGAYSPNSVILLGKTPDTKTTSTYIGFGKLIDQFDNGTEIYVTRGIFPFSEFVYPKRDNGNNIDVVQAYGLSPLGYQLIYPRKYFNFYAGISSGIMLVNKTFPTDKGRRINYSFDISFGVKRPIQKNTFLSLGYQFHHISNAQTGTQNPGVDSNFLFISIKHFTNVD
jgi:hypothetical protein